MGKIYLGKFLVILAFGVFVTLGAILITDKKSCAQTAGTSTNPCQIQNTFPSGMSAPVSEFGDNRSHGGHTGADFFYYRETLVTVPPGCVIQRNSSGNLVWEQNSKKGNGTPQGYGWYVVFDCGRQNGQTIKMRLAHVPKQPFGPGGAIRVGCSGNASAPNNVTGELSHGCSRSGAHYHVEVIVGNRPIDPQCVLGMAKSNANADGASANCKRCPQAVPPGAPANLCDNNQLQALIAHGVDCSRGRTVNIAGGTSVDPNSIKGGQPTPGTPDTTPPGGTDEGDDGGTDIDPSDGTGGPGWTPPDIFWPTDPGPQPPDGPGPNDPPDEPLEPGEPGGNPEIPTLPNSGEIMGCASDTWTAMVNQSLMETRREDIVNKRMIVKADSVLDYGCFQMYVQRVAQNAGPIFSESTEWYMRPVDLIGKVVIMQMWLGSMSLDNALASVVERSLDSYRNRHFNHDFVSGTVQVQAGTGADCTVMSNIWQAAKCKNFETPWYTFQDLTTTEPRVYPPNFVCGGGGGGGGGTQGGTGGGAQGGGTNAEGGGTGTQGTADGDSI